VAVAGSLSILARENEIVPAPPLSKTVAGVVTPSPQITCAVCVLAAFGSEKLVEALRVPPSATLQVGVKICRRLGVAVFQDGQIVSCRRRKIVPGLDKLLIGREGG
jgi:hypothetical protein